MIPVPALPMPWVQPVLQFHLVSPLPGQAVDEIVEELIWLHLEIVAAIQPEEFPFVQQVMLVGFAEDSPWNFSLKFFLKKIRHYLREHHPHRPILPGM